MKKILLFLVLLFACSNIATAQYGKNSGIWEFKNEVHNSVFLIRLLAVDENGNEGFGYGTGFIIKIETDKEVNNGYYGYGLTAAHVCGESGTKGIDIFYQSGEHAKNAYVVSSNNMMDLAIIKIWVPKNAKAVPLATEAVKRGDEVEIIGYGYPDTNKLEQRRFLGKVDGPKFDNAFFINHHVVPGDSGGLILNKKGEVVGIIQAGLVRYQWDKENTSRVTVWPAKSGSLNCIKDITKHLFQ